MDGPGLVLETWAIRLGTTCKEKPRSPKRDLGHPPKAWSLQHTLKRLCYRDLSDKYTAIGWPAARQGHYPQGRAVSVAAPAAG